MTTEIGGITAIGTYGNWVSGDVGNVVSVSLHGWWSDTDFIDIVAPIEILSFLSRITTTVTLSSGYDRLINEESSIYDPLVEGESIIITSLQKRSNITISLTFRSSMI